MLKKFLRNFDTYYWWFLAIFWQYEIKNITILHIYLRSIRITKLGTLKQGIMHIDQITWDPNTFVLLSARVPNENICLLLYAHAFTHYTR